jgi:hypothetical protein
MDESESREPDGPHGEVPEGVGPEVFRERLRQASQQDPVDGAHITLEKEVIFLADIESVEAEPEGEGEGHRSRVRLRNGLIIGGVTGAAIVAALATVRYRRRHH